MWSCQYCALSERCQFYQIERLPTPVKNCAIATLQPHNLSQTFWAMKYTYFFIKIRNHIFSGTRCSQL